MTVRPHDIAEAKLACAGKVELHEVPLDDSWSRDFGPTFLLGPASARAGVEPSPGVAPLGHSIANEGEARRAQGDELMSIDRNVTGIPGTEGGF